MPIHRAKAPGAAARPPERGRPHRAISRRAAIGLGAAGVATAAGAASLFDFFSKWRDAEAPADIFKGDAPKGELWELWRKRGWVKEASHYLKLGRNVQCKVCPNNCLLSPGDRSHCRNKVNRDGTLYTLAYAQPLHLPRRPGREEAAVPFPARQPHLLARHLRLRLPLSQLPELGDFAEETRGNQGPARRGVPPAPAVAAEPHAWTRCARLSLFPEDVAGRGRGAGLSLDLLHLLRADGLLRIHLRHLQGGARAQAQEHRRDLRLDRGARRRATSTSTWMPRTWT